MQGDRCLQAQGLKGKGSLAVFWFSLNFDLLDVYSLHDAEVKGLTLCQPKIGLEAIRYV